MYPFVAIDFETADPKRDSACAIGVCRVEGAEIVYSNAALIKPPRSEVHPMCRAVHGLSWNDLKDQPPFADVWKKFLPAFKGVKRIAAHNVSFDRSVLAAGCCLARIAPPALEWVCTLQLARAKWPKPAKHDLASVCGYLGIAFANHHHAGADAEACAKVLIALEGRVPAEAPPETPEPPTEPVEVWVNPGGVVGAILERIPIAQRTNAVVRLMRDCEALGPLHAEDLVRRVAEFARWQAAREKVSVPRCACGARCSLLCPKCAECIDRENQ